MIRQRDTFFEVQATGRHLLTIKTAGGLGGGSISLRSLPMQAVITQWAGGTYETTAPVAVTAQETEARIVDGSLDPDTGNPCHAASPSRRHATRRVRDEGRAP